MTALFHRPEYALRPTNLLRRLILRRWWRGREAIVHLKCGGWITVREGEFIGNHLINTRCHDPALGEFLWRIIRPGDTCIDAGANIGYVTLLMSERCGAGGRCLSFEADPDLFLRLSDNVRRNQLLQVTAENVAVSDRAGTLTFQRAGEMNQGLGHVVESGAAGGLAVRAIRLDDYLPAKNVERVRVMKIDVEGHEFHVLQGLAGMLGAKTIEHLVLEEHGGAGAPSIELLRKAGYTIFRLVRSLYGPQLVAAETAVGGDLEPNFVAALDPDGLVEQIKQPGWHIF